MTLVKICGLRSESELEAASCADFLGFVVEAGSRRRLEPARARELMGTTSNRTVLVTTCKDVEKVLDLAAYLEPNVVQINSLLPPEDLKGLKEGLEADLWALFPAGHPLDRPLLKHVSECCDRVVLDTPSLNGGGTGEVHDWRLSRAIRDQLVPQGCVLAGGLRPDNVAEAIRTVLPEVVDVSTGVEKDGGKSAWEIERFVLSAWSVR